ncbi:MAG: cyclase family protein [Gemmatimonadaceae bacterium]
MSGPRGRRLRDISTAVRPGTPEWRGDTPYSCRWTWAISSGSSVNVSAIEMSPHVGTHADAPLHVRDDGPASDALSPDAFVGPAIVVGLEELGGPVDAHVLAARLPARVERLLLRTGRTIATGAFPIAWPALTPACVRWLATRGLRLLGVDAPSVDDRESKTLDTHHALFEAGAAILENLDLRGVPDGSYELIALPLRLDGLDAAPVRAVLVEAT